MGSGQRNTTTSRESAPEKRLGWPACDVLVSVRVGRKEGEALHMCIAPLLALNVLCERQLDIPIT